MVTFAKLADGQLAGHVDPAVDVRRVRLAARDPGLVDQDLDGLADALGADGGGDFLLQGHHPVPAALLLLGRNLARHLAGARALLLRIAEDAEALEPRLADEFAQLVDVRLGLAGEPDDEGRPQGDSGDAGADPADEVANVGAARLALHRRQHPVADVLQGHVHVAGHLGAFGDGPDQLVAPVRRMGVKDADPEVALRWR